MAAPELLPWEYGSQQPMLLGIFGLFIALSTICVALRFLAKWRCCVAWGMDDILIVFGWVFNIALPVGAIIDVKRGGAGLHIGYVAANFPEKLIVLKQFIAAFPIIYLAAVIFPKLVLIHLYLSIFVQKTFRVVCWIVVGIILVNWLASTIAAFKICVPFDYMWNPQPGGYCGNQNGFFLWLSFPNILTDVVLLALPVPYILKIKISLTLRLGILFTFLLGSIGLIASIVRFVEFSDSRIESDPTWIAGTLLLWSVIEPAVYLIAACLPSYRPLIKLWYRKISGQPATVATLNSTYRKEYARFGGSGSSQPRREEDEIRLHDVQRSNINGISPQSSEDFDESTPANRIRIMHKVEFGHDSIL